MEYEDFKNTVMAFQKNNLFCDAPNNALYCTYKSGGICGGSCWDESKLEEYYNDEPMDEFEEFHEAIKKIVPNISLEQIVEMEKELVKETSLTVDEYYGNCERYVIRYVNLEKFYQYLINNKLIFWE